MHSKCTPRKRQLDREIHLKFTPTPTTSMDLNTMHYAASSGPYQQPPPPSGLSAAGVDTQNLWESCFGDRRHLIHNTCVPTHVALTGGKNKRSHFKCNQVPNGNVSTLQGQVPAQEEDPPPPRTRPTPCRPSGWVQLVRTLMTCGRVACGHAGRITNSPCVPALCALTHERTKNHTSSALINLKKLFYTVNGCPLTMPTVHAALTLPSTEALCIWIILR
jgi:hypothetical protein